MQPKKMAFMRRWPANGIPVAHAIIRDVHPTCPLNCTRENIRCIIIRVSSRIVGHTREMPTKESHMDGQTDRQVNSHKRRLTVVHEGHFLIMIMIITIT